MIEFLKQLSLNALMGANGNDVVSPIYEGLTLVGPYALSIVAVLSIFYGIFLGVKYAKADDAASKQGAQKTLINFIIGAVTIWVLIAVLYAARGPLAEWIDG